MEKKIFKGFLTYMGHLGHVSRTILNKLSFPRPKEPPYLFVFVALRPKSTAMVIAGRSVHLTTLFPGQA